MLGLSFSHSPLYCLFSSLFLLPIYFTCGLNEKKIRLIFLNRESCLKSKKSSYVELLWFYSLSLSLLLWLYFVLSSDVPVERYFQISFKTCHKILNEDFISFLSARSIYICSSYIHYNFVQTWYTSHTILFCSKLSWRDKLDALNITIL